MEDLEIRLNSNNPTIIAQIFSKIVESIQQKYKTEKKEVLELKFLKDKCISPDPLISEVAAAGIINLVRDEVLQLDTTLTDFITLIPLTKCCSSLTKIIGNLLYLEMKRLLTSNKEYKSFYNLCLPQHPFVTILIENSNAWSCIFNEIRDLYAKGNENYITDLFRPVYLYILCNPTQTDLNLLKQKIWTHLLHCGILGSNFFYDMLCWMHVETKNNLEANSELLNEALDRCCISTGKEFNNLEVLLLWQTSMLYNLTLNKQDIRSCIYCLRNALSKTDSLIIVNCLLLALTKTIEICSSVYLVELLNLCKTLLSYHGKEIYILEALKASLLQWLVCPSLLTTDAHEVINNMFTYIQKYRGTPQKEPSLKAFSDQLSSVFNSNTEVFSSMEFCLLLYGFTEENTLEWLQKLENSPPCLIRSAYHFLCGIFLAKTANPTLALKSFAILLNYVEHNKLLSSQLLVLILYKLSNTRDPQLHFALLKALPKMIVLRENIAKVMATLQAVSKGSADLYNFSLSLMFDAWKLDHKCYSYLESMLVQQNYQEKKWESYVTKAYILKELCERKPELYGKDMVAHLSKVLNECHDDDGALPSALAIDGITMLCRAEIIDVVTTWATLSPKYKKESRIRVIKSLCSLIHEIPYLPYTESFTELQDDVIRALWDYVDLGDPQITEAALNALTSFSFEQICSHLPEKYIEDNVMQDRQKNVAGAPHTVPGHTWLKFLTENGASKAACDFLVKMISIEVDNYLKYVYQVKGSREPMNYAYLPTHSIVRGIGEFLRTWINKWKNSIHDLLYIECLKIFSKEYSKPLPPLDWCFLQELLHEPRVKGYCVDIACHQSILSGTARRLAENYIAAVTENPEENDIINVLRNLKHLANSIQPLILKPFLENAIDYASSRFDNEYGEKLLEKISNYLVEVLQNEKVQDTNKTTIAQVLNEQIVIVDVTSEKFPILLKCLSALPSKSIKNLTPLKPDDSEEWLEKVTKIRCFVAIHTTVAPLSWLNEIIEVLSTLERNPNTFSELITVFKKHTNNPAECALWLLELIGQIQAKVADRCDEKEMVYFFDVFILTIVEFSGYSAFIKDQTVDYDAQSKRLFPQAFNALLSMNDWSICANQALEWLYHMNSEETVPREYRNLFGQVLQALRHDDEFMKNFRWMKYLSTKISNDE